MEYVKDAQYRRKGDGYVMRLDSWGEKYVKLGLGTKLIQIRLSRDGFERDWEPLAATHG